MEAVARGEDVDTGAVVTLLVGFLDELRQAATMADVAIAAGIAHQDLIGLVGGLLDLAS